MRSTTTKMTTSDRSSLTGAYGRATTGNLAEICNQAEIGNLVQTGSLAQMANFAAMDNFGPMGRKAKAASVDVGAGGVDAIATVRRSHPRTVARL